MGALVYKKALNRQQNLFSGLPHHHLIFKVDVVIEMSEDIHSQQPLMGDRGPFVVNHQNIGAF